MTTWYKPTGAVPPPPPAAEEEEEGMQVNFDCTLETHNVAMTGFISTVSYTRYLLRGDIIE